MRKITNFLAGIGAYYVVTKTLELTGADKVIVKKAGEIWQKKQEEWKKTGEEIREQFKDELEEARIIKDDINGDSEPVKHDFDEFKKSVKEEKAEEADGVCTFEETPEDEVEAKEVVEEAKPTESTEEHKDETPNEG